MRQKTDSLRKLLDEYQDCRGLTEKHYLDESWQGAGNAAFVARWDGLDGYINGGDGVRHYLNLQLHDMDTLADNVDRFQKQISNLVETQLGNVKGTGKGLRECYIEALTHDGSGSVSITAIVDKANQIGGLGAGVGELAGPESAAAVGAFGFVLGAVMGFLEESENSARKNLHIARTEMKFAATLDELGKKLNVMDRNRYSDQDGDKPGDDGYGKTEYDPETSGMLNERWGSG